MFEYRASKLVAPASPDDVAAAHFSIRYADLYDDEDRLTFKELLHDDIKISKLYNNCNDSEREIPHGKETSCSKRKYQILI